jgi:stage V sporulation protein K
MRAFLESNPGLRSRFAREISFPDYATDELIEIAVGFAAANGYRLSAEALAELRSTFEAVERGEGFGNARFARTLFEQALNAQAVRLTGGALAGLGRDDLMELTGEDIAGAARALGEEATEVRARRRWLGRS